MCTRSARHTVTQVWRRQKQVCALDQLVTLSLRCGADRSRYVHQISSSHYHSGVAWKSRSHKHSMKSAACKWDNNQLMRIKADTRWSRRVKMQNSLCELLSAAADAVNSELRQLKDTCSIGDTPTIPRWPTNAHRSRNFNLSINWLPSAVNAFTIAAFRLQTSTTHRITHPIHITTTTATQTTTTTIHCSCIAAEYYTIVIKMSDLT